MAIVLEVSKEGWKFTEGYSSISQDMTALVYEGI